MANGLSRGGISHTAMADSTDLFHHMINASIVAETTWKSGGTRYSCT
jgi:hypothetical protein